MGSLVARFQSVDSGLCIGDRSRRDSHGDNYEEKREHANEVSKKKRAAGLKVSRFEGWQSTEAEEATGKLPRLRLSNRSRRIELRQVRRCNSSLDRYSRGRLAPPSPDIR